MSGPRGGETSWAMEAAGAFLSGFSFFLHHWARWEAATQQSREDGLP